MCRRAAVLSFVSKMAPYEMRHLIQLMMRGILPSARLLDMHLQQLQQDISANSTMIHKKQDNALSIWYDRMDNIVTSMNPTELQQVAWERLIGFLHVLQPLVRILGYSITEYVPIVYKIVLVVLTHAQNCRDLAAAAAATVYRNSNNVQLIDDENEEQVEEEDEDDEVDDDGDKQQQEGEILLMKKAATQALRVRSLCLLRIAGKFMSIVSIIRDEINIIIVLYDRDD